MKKLPARNYRPFFRKYKAYSVALTVTFSYLKINLLSKLFGKGYYRRRIEQLHLKNAHRVKNGILELQGLFIKIGQLISILSNILPDEFRAPLESLQDKIPPRPYAEVAEVITRELGQPPAQLFDSFEVEPLAAASVGQVHRAVLHGEKVVVKVQHANIPLTARADLRILKNLVRIHAFFMDIKGLDHLYEQVHRMIADELDYRREADSMQRIRKNLREDTDLRVHIPRVFGERSTERVLTTGYLSGINIGRIDQIEAWGIDRRDLARRVLELYCKMVLLDGFYQADPHPGNILVNRNGDICLLDYGATAYLTENTKNTIPLLIEAVLKDDTEEIVKALKKMGFVADGREAERMTEGLIDIFRRFLAEEVEFNGMDFKEIKLKSGLTSITDIIRQTDIREVAGTVQIPKDYVLLYRAVVLLIGVTFQVAPDLNPVDVVKPYIENNLISRKDSIKGLIVNTLRSQITTTLALPQDLHRFLKETSRGETEVQIAGTKAGFTLLWWAAQMWLFGILAALAAAALWIFPSEMNDRVRLWLYGITAFCAIFFLRAWRKGGNLRKKM